jgi:hypothetical protein
VLVRRRPGIDDPLLREVLLQVKPGEETHAQEEHPSEAGYDGLALVLDAQCCSSRQ